MIGRYRRAEMAAVWERQSRYGLWLEIETAVLDAQAALGVVPAEAALAVRRARIDSAAIDRLEATLRHEVIAFLTHVGDQMGEEGRYLHYGLTSSDILDTALALQLTRAGAILEEGLARMIAALEGQVRRHRRTPCLGRTHGMAAEPTTFGLKLAGHLAEFQRARTRLAWALREIAVCKIAGAVGTYATVDPKVEAQVAAQFGLAVETAATQVVPRDRHAVFFAVLAVIAGAVERLATEIRNLQRIEIGEVEEPFPSGQKGSSAMPHKRNPLFCETLCGLARVVRAGVVPALENMVLWHERDMSHSSVERVVAPDTTLVLDYALHSLAAIVEGLTVHPERMAENLARYGQSCWSQKALLVLVGAGMSREAAYRLVQGHALAAAAGGASFLERLLADPELPQALPPDTLAGLDDPLAFLDHADIAIDRALGWSGEA
ncbi:adenylosuccinate lyase [Rhodospirillum rubrum]|uniref:adenylosuccinate lyase n=1 Tax=Rhodospirillum rubrum TaxID=1085 RepID=UPI0019061B76|nr:adenylosuccinate lyase [Rhodospirillum rubrum]MBK1666082.1 adenylosuccinate lyase [Rhodospirillum rubrum]MBK1678348.1 adenylosuccinate lyase [Rhodospirillum rubrum]